MKNYLVMYQLYFRHVWQRLTAFCHFWHMLYRLRLSLKKESIKIKILMRHLNPFILEIRHIDFQEKCPGYPHFPAQSNRGEKLYREFLKSSYSVCPLHLPPAAAASPIRSREKLYAHYFSHVRVCTCSRGNIWLKSFSWCCVLPSGDVHSGILMYLSLKTT